MGVEFRKATQADLPEIMEIIAEAKAFIKSRGSDQWQDGYPDQSNIEEDLTEQIAYVLTKDNVIAGYVAITFGEDPAYTAIRDGAWGNDGTNYVEVHRLAMTDKFRGQGLTKIIWQEIFKMGEAAGYYDFRSDTSAENSVMRHVMEREGMTYRGIVFVAGGDRVAYQLEIK